MRPTLHMLCGKIASGKSTLAHRLSAETGAILLPEDQWLDDLYGPELQTLADYRRFSERLKTAMEPHILALLNSGMSVVLDFQANTIEARAWMRSLLHQTRADHVLHLLEVPDDVALNRLETRNARGDHPFAVSAEQFQAINAYFIAPRDDEGFNVQRHTAAH